MRPSLKHIAEECGVSTMAVSKALRGHSSISEQRRIEIKAIAERIGYQPNISAISLRGGKTHSIGILWSLGGPHDAIGLIRDISLKLMHNDYVSFVADSLGDPKIIKSCLKDYVARNIDGLIIQVRRSAELDTLLTAENMQYLKQISNVIVVNESGADLPKQLHYDEIQRPRQPATEDIIDYLVSRGRQRIVMLAGSFNSWRERQFVEYLKGHGLETKNCRLINHSDNSAIVPDSLLQKIYFEGSLNYDAVLTHSDGNAAQVINYLQKQGMKVPEDVAVVGFNNSLLGPYITPPIASVERRAPELAAAAVDMLMTRIKNQNAALQQMNLPMRFIKRESAG